MLCLEKNQHIWEKGALLTKVFFLNETTESAFFVVLGEYDLHMFIKFIA